MSPDAIPSRLITTCRKVNVGNHMPRIIGLSFQNRDGKKLTGPTQPGRSTYVSTSRYGASYKEWDFVHLCTSWQSHWVCADTYSILLPASQSRLRVPNRRWRTFSRH